MIGRGCIQNGAANHQHRPIGSILVRPAGKNRRRPCVLVKVRDHGPMALRWQYLAVFVWERHHGPVPEGFCLWHRDLNSVNCADENLELITKAERLKRNMAANYDTWLKANHGHTAKMGKKYWRTALDARRVKRFRGERRKAEG